MQIAEQGKLPFKKGSPYQMVISTANVDPHVFGGQDNSESYAQSFDPARDHSDSLSWNGRLADVKVRTYEHARAAIHPLPLLCSIEADAPPCSAFSGIQGAARMPRLQAVDGPC